MFGFEVAGGFFNYEFYAHPVGTTFYHSHVSTQHEAGLSGLVHVRDPKDAWLWMVAGHGKEIPSTFLKERESCQRIHEVT